MKNSREQTIQVSLNGTNVLELLPGSEYEKVLMPLEYHPSMDLRPRWGFSRPLNPKLLEILSASNQKSLEVIQGVKSLEQYFNKIGPKFDGQSIGWVGGAMNPIDSALYYYFISKSKPQTIVEIGSGISTHFARRAISDFQLNTQLLSIDPNPRAEVDRLCNRIIRNGLETMDNFDVFLNLNPGDIVFLDGSHRSFMNSDVTVFFIDILPFLKSGVLIQIHDIHLPYDYSEMFKYWYWSEQYLLATYLLAGHEKLDILFPGWHVCTEPNLKNELQKNAPVVQGVEAAQFYGAGSFWFTKK